jgi:hypothetical protein
MYRNIFLIMFLSVSSAQLTDRPIESGDKRTLNYGKSLDPVLSCKSRMGYCEGCNIFCEAMYTGATNCNTKRCCAEDKPDTCDQNCFAAEGIVTVIDETGQAVATTIDKLRPGQSVRSVDSEGYEVFAKVVLDDDATENIPFFRIGYASGTLRITSNHYMYASLDNHTRFSDQHLVPAYTITLQHYLWLESQWTPVLSITEDLGTVQNVVTSNGRLVVDGVAVVTISVLENPYVNNQLATILTQLDILDIGVFLDVKFNQKFMKPVYKLLRRLTKKMHVANFEGKISKLVADLYSIRPTLVSHRDFLTNVIAPAISIMEHIKMTLIEKPVKSSQ